MRTPLIAGNWKMHKTLAEARELLTGLRTGLERILPESRASARADDRGSSQASDRRGGAPTSPLADGPIPEVLICPPVQLLFPIAKAVVGTPIMFGAQNAHEEAQGAFTGEVSAPMLKDTGCTHVIIGHSERRHIFGEQNERLAKKVRAVVEAGLTVIYCVGETLDERESGRTEQVVQRQIEQVIAPDVPADRLVIAYEPVWAIGTGKTATPEQAQDMHRFVRSRLASIYGAATADGIRILYGGSVKPGNAAGLLAQPDIDGALVGGACLVAEDFLAIISAAMPG